MSERETFRVTLIGPDGKPRLVDLLTQDGVYIGTIDHAPERRGVAQIAGDVTAQWSFSTGPVRTPLRQLLDRLQAENARLRAEVYQLKSELRDAGELLLNLSKDNNTK